MPALSSTLYSHNASFDLILNTVVETYPDCKIDFDRNEQVNIALITIKKGFLSKSRKLKISFKERIKPSFELDNPDDPFVRNLIGMTNMVQSIESKNQDVKKQLIQKIGTINSEFNIEDIENAKSDYFNLVKKLAIHTKAFIFSNPNTFLNASQSQQFLDSNVRLILDMTGNCDVENIDVTIDSKFFDKQEPISVHQGSRKEKSEALLHQKGIKVNNSLPPINDENNTKLRSQKEVSERLVALALTNLVAFKNISGEKAIDFANKNNISHLLTPKELEFLKNPTDESCQRETWKCECIWVLSWALENINYLGFPDVLADLSKIPSDSYPIGSGKPPGEFIANSSKLRNKVEIFDATDLYYRLNWACVDARINNIELNTVHSGVVYERHYALNWLIYYRNQDWDHITTDT